MIRSIAKLPQIKIDLNMLMLAVERIDEDDIPAVVEELQEYYEQLKMRSRL